MLAAHCPLSKMVSLLCVLQVLVDLVIDLSVLVDVSRTPNAFHANMEMEFGCVFLLHTVKL
jgi:aconitase A